MERTTGFNRHSSDDLALALWILPTGEDVLVCKKPYGGGFFLYQKDEWNGQTRPALEADQDGCVLRADQYVGYHDPAWTVPQAVREHAICQ
jgi:hypothetical protein